MKLTIEKLEANTIHAFSNLETRETMYGTAESTNGGKAHKYYYYVSAVDGKIRGQGLPYCGSRNRSWTGHGTFSNAVTCGKCL